MIRYKSRFNTDDTWTETNYLTSVDNSMYKKTKGVESHCGKRYNSWLMYTSYALNQYKIIIKFTYNHGYVQK